MVVVVMDGHYENNHKAVVANGCASVVSSLLQPHRLELIILIIMVIKMIIRLFQLLSNTN